MIITQKALPRRTFLRGAGAMLALPWLDAMAPAMTALAAPLRRLGFVYIPNGAVMDHWTPAAEGTAFDLPPILAALAPFRDRLVVVSGLAHHNADNNGDGNGDHSRASAVWLSGVRPRRTEGADVTAGTTADQVAARHLGQHTPLASLELGLDANYLVGNCENGYSCVYMNTISWRTPSSPIPMENDPRVVFERMFGEGGDRKRRLAEMRKDRSILDSVGEDMARLQRELGPADRTRVGEYVEAVRDVERRIQRAEKQGALVPLPVLQRPLGIPEKFDDHLALMLDLQVLAWQADLTRVISFMLGRELNQRTYGQIGVSEPHHTLSHHQNDKEKIAKVIKINTYHVEKLAGFLDRLRSTPDGDGTLLDHALLLYGGGISDGNLHNHSSLPALVMGGGAGQLQGGRHLKYPDGTPMANLLLTLLDKAGVPTETLGDATGRLDRL